MSIQENVIALALKLTGGETFNNLSKSADELRGQLGQLVESYARGDVSAGEFEKTSRKLSGEIDRQEKLLNGFRQAEEQAAAATEAATAAIANQGASASAWGAVIANATRTGEEFTESLRNQAVADKEQVATYNKLIGLTTLSAESVQKDTQAIQANAKAIANAGASGSAWGAVIANATKTGAEFTAQLQRESVAAAEQVGTFNKVIGLTVIQDAELRKLTDAETNAAVASSNLKAAQGAMAGGVGLTTDQIKQLNAKLQQADLDTKALSAAFLAGKINADQYRAGIEHINATAAPFRGIAQSVGSASSSMGGLNTTVRNLGYGISDVFSNNGPLGQKIQGFANNVGNISTGILSMLGKVGPGALAAAAALEIGFTAAGAAMTAMGIKSVDDLVRVFTGGVKTAENSLKGLEDRIGELTEKPHLIAVEMLELDNAKKRVDEIKAALDTVNRLEKSQAHYEAESGKAVGETFKEAKDDKGNLVGGKGVKDTFRAQVARELQASSDQAAAAEQAPLQARIKELEKAQSERGDEDQDPEVAKELSRQRAALAASRKKHETQRTRITTADGTTPAEADTAIGNTIKAAQDGSGEAQRSAQKELADRARRAGLTDVARGFDEADPEAVKAKDLHKKAAEKLKQLEDILHSAGESDDQVKAALESVAKATDKELDQIIHDTKVSIADGKKGDIAKAKEAAAAKRERSGAVADTNHSEGADLKAAALKARAGGQSEDDVKPDLIKQLRAKLDAAGKVPEATRGDVVKDVVDHAVEGISDTAIAAERAKSAKGPDKRADQNQAEQHTRFKTGVGETRKTIEKTSIDEESAALAAQLRANGGYTDERSGKKVNLDETQQYIKLAQYLDKLLSQRFPGMEKNQRQAVAGQVAQGGFDAAQGEFDRLKADVARNAQQSNQTVPQFLGVANQQQANQVIGNQTIANTLNAVNNLMGQVQQSRADLDGLLRKSAQTNLRSRTAAPRSR